MTEERRAGTDTALKDIAGLARLAGYGFVGRLTGYASAPVSALLVTRILGAELYGIYAFLVQIEGLFSAVCSFGLNNALTRYCARFKSDGTRSQVNRLLRFSFLILGVTSAIVFLTLILFPGLYARFTRFTFDPDYVRFYAVAIPLTVLYSGLLAALKGFSAFREHTLIYGLAGNAAKITVLVAVLASGLGLYAVLSANLLRNMVILILALFVLKRMVTSLSDVPASGRSVFDRKEIIRFSGSVYTAGLLRKQAFDTDILFLAYFHSAAEVGLYAVVTRLLPLVYAPHYVLLDVFAPVVASLHDRDQNRLNEIYRVVSRWSLTLALPVFLVFLFSGAAGLAFFGSAFSEAYPALIVAGVGGLFAAYFGTSGQLIVMSGRNKMNLANSGISFVMIISLYLWLIPPHGMFGAALASAIYLVAVNLVRLAEITMVLGYKPFDISIWKPLASALLAGACAAGFQTLTGPLHFVSSFFLDSLAVCLFYVLFILLFGLDESDKTVITELKNRLLKTGRATG